MNEGPPKRKEDPKMKEIWDTLDAMKNERIALEKELRENPDNKDLETKIIAMSDKINHYRATHNVH